MVTGLAVVPPGFSKTNTRHPLRMAPGKFPLSQKTRKILSE
jgi:hypothetical protein